jgi:hypothetical protein
MWPQSYAVVYAAGIVAVRFSRRLDPDVGLQIGKYPQGFTVGNAPIP